MPSPPPPPRRFIAAAGVRSAHFLPGKPQFITRRKSRGRFAVGQRYEREVQERLALFALGQPELEHRDGPWLAFQDESGRRWCQPDALLVDAAARMCVVCEVKYQHTSDAWWQLKHLYRPVLGAAMPDIVDWRLLEIVHWYDPSTVFPEQVTLVPTLDQICSRGSRPGEGISVLIFNKRREHRFLADGGGERAGAGETPRPLWPAEGAD